MSDQLEQHLGESTPHHAEVEDRFGILPNFFRLAPEAPVIAENLWGFAKVGYLDNPLPPLFKERLFVYLSRFCEARYCIARHVGFLVGLGRPSGDRGCSAQTIEQVVRLIRRQLPRDCDLEPFLVCLEAFSSPLKVVPGSETPIEEAIFACATHVFLQTTEAARCLAALRRVFDPELFQHLLVFLSFVRTAHFWTKLHPELQTEDDINDLLAGHESLAECVLNDPEAKSCETTQSLLNELLSLRHERALREDVERANLALRGSEERLRLAVGVAKLGQWSLDLRSRVMSCSDSCKANYGRGSRDPFTYDDLWRMVHLDDLDRVQRAVQRAIENRTDYDTEYRTVWPDGGVHWVLVRGRADYGTDGTPLTMNGVTLDITDRKRVEEQLQSSEERYRSLFDTMDEGFVVIEVEFDSTGHAIDYRHVEANPAFEKHTGLRSHLGKSVRQTVPGLEEFWFTTYGRVAATGEPTRFEHEAKPLGDRWFDVYASRLGEAGSNRVAVLFTDITVRKRAEEAVRASEARNSFQVTLADALRPLSDPIAVQAEANRVLGERLKASRVVYFEVRGDEYVVERDYATGVPSVVGRHKIASFGPDQLAIYQSGRTAAEADVNAFPSRPDAEKMAFAGVQIRAYIGVPLVKGGNFAAGLAVHSDCVREWTQTEIAMTEDTAERTWAAVERARVEAALRASEERRRMALDSAELGAWHVDPATMTLTTDDRFRAIFGVKSHRLSYEDAIAVIDPEDQLRVRDAVADATRPEDPLPYAVEYRVIHEDGSIHWVHAKGRANFEEDDSGRRLVNFDGTVNDITARKHAEHERERLVQELRVQDQRKDEFLATLAHELRNPLAPIRNGLQVLRLSGVTDEMAHDARTMMERQLGQMVRLIDDLLDLSRISRGKIELRKEHVDLAKAIQQAVETSRPLIEAGGHNLTISLTPDPIYVDADLTRLAQVFSNLLNNAAKYTERGGRVQLAVQRHGPEVVVSVKDNGVGIPAAMLSKVFEMFTQVDHHLERSQGGLGIGLSIVQRLVEMHGGSVGVESDGPGRGSEFVVRLPMVPSAAPPNGCDQEPAQPLDHHKILVVDDNVDAATSLAMVLKLMGHDALTAHDGLEALDVAAAYRPDLILLDIGMPRLNGYDTAKRIRQELWGQRIMLVALTGWGQEEDRRMSDDAGFDSHMVKPIEPAAVEKLLSNLQADRT